MSSSSSRSSFRSTSSSRYSHKKQQRRRNQKKEDQDAGYFEHQIDMQIKEGQFVITRFLEDDTFGRVLEVRTCNTTNNKNYYVMKVKLFGFKHAYWLQKAKIETKILKYIQDKDKSGAFNIVRLFTSFERYDNYFMVFERLGKSLYDIVKQNNYFGFSMKYMQFFAKQIIIFVAFFHQNQITHTDPKPENILTTNCVINLFPSKEDKFGFLKEKFLKSLILEMLPLIMNTIILSQTQDNIVLLKLLWVIQNGMRVVIFDVQLLSYLNFLAQFSIYYYINHIDY